MATGAFATIATIDPLDIGVGTRALGMGKAFIAEANDVNSVFMNPAGLSYMHDWGFTSMYTMLLGEISYTTLAVSHSTSMEGWGLGYVSANVNGTSYLTQIDPLSNRIVPVDSFAASYMSSVLMFSYGTVLSKYLSYPYMDKTSAGFTVKAFYQQLRGTEESAGSGLDLDVGIIYAANSWLKFGLYGQNILPDSFGFAGNLRWDNGESESIPANYKLGTSFKALGEDGFWSYPQELFLNLDLEDSFLPARPSVIHVGTEWWPFGFMAVRLGVDQDVHQTVAGSGVDQNLTFGLGFWYGDVGFDYAYHQYGPVESNLTHYFSLSYGFPGTTKLVLPEPQKEAVPVAPSEPIFISEPRDKSIVYSDLITVSGEVDDKNVAEIRVNENVVEVSTNEAKPVFTAKVGIGAVGKSLVRVKCLSADGKVIKEYNIRIIRLPTFKDVPGNFWARDKINNLAVMNLIGGYPDGTFKPNKVINRSELTALLVKSKGMVTPEAVETGFKDVKRNSWASYFIKNGVALGIVSGYPDKTFKPGKSVTRAEGVTIFSRFAQLQEPQTITVGPFPDVPGRHWAAKSIMAAKSAGLLIYLIDKPFEPNKEMTRAEAAEILSQTQAAKDKEAELYDWESGYGLEPTALPSENSK